MLAALLKSATYGVGVVLVGVIAFPYFALLNSRGAALVMLAVIASLIPHDLQYGRRPR